LMKMGEVARRAGGGGARVIIFFMRRGLLLYNPAAGRVSVRPFLRGILRPLNAAGWQIDVVETLSSAHTTRAARQAVSENYEAIFTIGGDGTIGHVTAGLIGSETALAPIPGGTANVWGLEQGMKPFTWYRWWALKDNARLLANSLAQRVDVGLCNDRPFLLWAGIGLDALTIHKMGPRSRFVKYLSVPQFFATTVWEATFWHGMDLHVVADGKQIDGHFLLAVATNVRHYAGGMTVLSPDAYLDDGRMDLWLFSGNNMADAFRHFFDMLGGRHLTSEQARCLPFQNATINSQEAFSIQMDGEPMGGGQRAELSVRSRALKVLMPRKALHLLKNPS
jgi:diacylglycerol kinase (ATP)